MTHMQGHERDAFERAVEDGDQAALQTAAGRLWNCTDIMPRLLCEDLELPQGTNYATAAHRIRRGQL